MKQICLSKELGSYSDFSVSELALLREESYELDDKGRGVIKPSILQLQKNIKFAFESFSKYFGSDFKLKINDIGWESFLKAIKIRNRLMHPKSIEDLNISDEEFEITRRANDWFEDSTSSALNSASEILETRAEIINKSVENINSFIDKLPEHLKNSLDSYKVKDNL